MVSMTKFDGTGAARRWLRILKEELAGPLSPGTWLERADARLDGRAASWAERTPENICIFSDKGIENATVEDKNTFVQLLLQEFPGDSRNVITDEGASRELSSLSQKEDEDLYTYYRRTEALLRGIHGKDRVTNNGTDTIILSPLEQYLLKDTIMKYILGIRDLDLRLRIVEYPAEPVQSLYGVFKKAEICLDVLRIRAQWEEELKLKQDYVAFKSFRVSLAHNNNKQDIESQYYDAPPCRHHHHHHHQPAQIGLSYREKIKRSQTQHPLLQS